MDTEQELLFSLKLGDEKAFNTIYNKYVKQVYNFCKLYIINNDEVEEVVQDVFVRLWESRYTIREDDNFKGLLFIITRNLVFNETRKSFNHDYYTVSIIDAIENMSEENCSNEVEQNLEYKDLSEFIDKLISELPPQRQKIFNLSRKEQKSYKEIAEIMNLSEKTVEHQISNAIKYLRKHLILFTLFL
ncbi:RNA polymerase sigma-70 factor [uncultured Bacteroides sp.]|uniref:RNA polymerase sigma factor n=1 Tax=uncultured Bacteroides sp. TaxID=162156 RepID=UPI002634B51C|nr:RNA polymerase sigma-70 factor [uncultured Bacteroides sp.]